MSSKTIVNCDLCGEEMGGRNGDLDLSVNIGGNHYTNIRVKDICRECSTKVGKVALEIKEKSSKK